MSRISRFLKNSYDKQIDGTGLAIFRIVYSLVLLCEIGGMYYFRHLIYDKVPYIDEAEINFAVPLGIWFIVVLFILFGAFTRFFTILNYLRGLVLIGTIHSFEYHVFYAYTGINFLMMFLPVSQCLSVDRLLMKLKYSNTTFQYNPTKNVRQIYYFLPLFVAVGLVYFDSMFFKFTAYSWISGLGMWMPCSLPVMAQCNLTPILNNEFLMIFLGYLTLAFEALFIFFFFRKKFRFTFFIIGFFLHIGILIAFPIPWFALTFCALYLLLLPVSFWKKVFSTNSSRKTLTFYYDAECPLCVRTKIIITHLDWFNKIDFKTVQFDAADNPSLSQIDKDVLLDDIHSVNLKGKVFSGVDTYIQVFQRIFYLYPISLILRIPGIYHIAKRIYSYVALNRDTERCTEENCGYNPPEIPNPAKIKILQNYTVSDLKFSFIKMVVYTFMLMQIIMITDSNLVNQFKEKIGFRYSVIDKSIYKLKTITWNISKPLFGITSHNVFIDEIHYKGYNHIIAIVYQSKDGKEIWLPIIDKNGQPSYYNYGTNWRKVSFSMNTTDINQEMLSKGVRDFTAFWAYKNGISLKDAKFLIKVKKMDTPKGWEKDFLNKQIAKPWFDGGFVEWKNEQFESQIKDIESL